MLDLARAVEDGRVEGPGARVRLLTFPSHDELEGYWPLAPVSVRLFAVAGRGNNLFSQVAPFAAGRATALAARREPVRHPVRAPQRPAMTHPTASHS